MQVTVNVAQSADEAAAQARGLTHAEIAAAADADEAEELEPSDDVTDSEI